MRTSSVQVPFRCPTSSIGVPRGRGQRTIRRPPLPARGSPGRRHMRRGSPLLPPRASTQPSGRSAWPPRRAALAAARRSCPRELADAEPAPLRRPPSFAPADPPPLSARRGSPPCARPPEPLLRASTLPEPRRSFAGEPRRTEVCQNPAAGEPRRTEVSAGSVPENRAAPIPAPRSARRGSRPRITCSTGDCFAPTVMISTRISSWAAPRGTPRRPWPPATRPTRSPAPRRGGSPGTSRDRPVPRPPRGAA